MPVLLKFESCKETTSCDTLLSALVFLIHTHPCCVHSLSILMSPLQGYGSVGTWIYHLQCAEVYRIGDPPLQMRKKEAYTSGLAESYS